MKINTAVLAAVFAVSLLTIPALILPGDVAADTNEDLLVDECWFYTVLYSSTSTNYEHLSWDFGDGVILDSRQSGTQEYEELLAANGGSITTPVHTYAEKGDYVVVHTAYNDYDGGSASTVSRITRIMGYPQIIYSGEGVDMEPQEVRPSEDWKFQPGTEPTAPVREGYDFGGWYTDAELTQPYDWTSKVKRTTTLYAKWTSVSDPVIWTVKIMMGDKEIRSISVPDGEKLTSESDTKYYTDVECKNEWDFDTPVTGDMNLYMTEPVTPANVSIVKMALVGLAVIFGIVAAITRNPYAIAISAILLAIVVYLSLGKIGRL